MKLHNLEDKERIIWAGIRNEDPIGRSYQKELIVCGTNRLASDVITTPHPRRQ